MPIKLAAIGKHHRITTTDAWIIMTPRHQPQSSLQGHLTFALKYEGLDLAVLKRLFLATGPAPIEHWVRSAPTGSYARRTWFLYEWLVGAQLDLPNAASGRYIDVVDDDLQFCASGTTSSRHRVKDNLPGNPDFCPLVFRTSQMREFCALDLKTAAHKAASGIPDHLRKRVSAQLLTHDAQSSYAIEGEHPRPDHIQRWGRAIGEAGQLPIDQDELLRLQKILIGNARFITLGLRREGGFVGDHDRQTRMPLPHHISARPHDLKALLEGLATSAHTPSASLDPVVAAAVLAFGFVYIHPLEDGNGRLHRYLLHYALKRSGFTPPDLPLPISSAILDQIYNYRSVLESYSARLLPLINWQPTDSFNVDVINDTADFYRYFDATPHAAFLYGCLQRIIQVDLPREVKSILIYERFAAKIDNLIDMPARTKNVMFDLLDQNRGLLPPQARNLEFAPLTDQEVLHIEAIYSECVDP